MIKKRPPAARVVWLKSAEGAIAFGAESCAQRVKEIEERQDRLRARVRDTVPGGAGNAQPSGGRDARLSQYLINPVSRIEPLGPRRRELYVQAWASRNAGGAVATAGGGLAGEGGAVRGQRVIGTDL